MTEDEIKALQDQVATLTEQNASLTKQVTMANAMLSTMKHQRDSLADSVVQMSGELAVK